MYRKIVWPLLLLASMSLMVVFIIGFVSSITVSNGNQMDNTTNVNETTNVDATQGFSEGDGDTNNNSNSNNNNNNNSNIDIDNPNILVLGDSIGFGIGDEPDQGLGRRYAALVDPEGSKDIKITNLSVSGAKSFELLELVKQPENAMAISEATLIIISIGGNDLNNIEAVDTMTTEIDYKETLNQYIESLQGIVALIRSLNTRAQLAIVGLYDPFADTEPSNTTNLLLQWNYETQRIAAADLRMVYIPTYELFQYNLSTHLAVDHFHPSSIGYQAIAEEMYLILHGLKIIND